MDEGRDVNEYKLKKYGMVIVCLSLLIDYIKRITFSQFLKINTHLNNNNNKIKKLIKQNKCQFTIHRVSAIGVIDISMLLAKSNFHTMTSGSSHVLASDS